MGQIRQATRVEILKARRSWMPLVTAGAFMIAPFAGGFFMIVLKDPELARRLGMISAKAQIVAGTAEWRTYLGILAQAVAVGGIILFGFVTSWIFGREYSDGTVTDLLALPTPRWMIVAAKFLVTMLWSLLLSALVLLVGLGVGALIGLPGARIGVFVEGVRLLAVTAVLAIGVSPPIGLLASVGRGYLPPLAGLVLAVVLAQLIAAAGWGAYFPWSVPALYAGMVGDAQAQLPAVSYWIVGGLGVTGIGATILWWTRADQP